MTITYLTGDATLPVAKPTLIMHVCNDVGGWGRGFVLALSKRWPEPEQEYRMKREYWLGQVQFIKPAGEDSDIVVANMIAQHGMYPVIIDPRDTVPPIRYDALATCLETVDAFAAGFGNGVTIHAPRIGAGLAGDSWSVIEPLIEHYLRDRNVYIYDLPEAAK